MIPRREGAEAEDREKGGEDGAVKEMKKKWARGKKVMP